MRFNVDIDDLALAMEQGEFLTEVTQDQLAPRGSVEIVEVKIHDQKGIFHIEAMISRSKWSYGTVPKKHFYDAIYDKKVAVTFWMRTTK